MPRNVCSFCRAPFSRRGVELRKDRLEMQLGPVEKPSRTGSVLVCHDCASQIAAHAKMATVAARAEMVASVPSPVPVLAHALARVPATTPGHGALTAAAKNGEDTTTRVLFTEAEEETEPNESAGKNEDERPSSPFLPEPVLTRVELHTMGIVTLESCELENMCAPGVCAHNPAHLTHGMGVF